MLPPVLAALTGSVLCACCPRLQRCWAQDAEQRPQAAKVVEELRKQVQTMRLPLPPQGGTPPRPPALPQHAAALGNGDDKGGMQAQM